MGQTHSSPMPLEGMRVLDLGIGPVTGITTMILADFGADVVNIEPIGGDRFRSLAHSPTWLRGKRTMECDLRSEEGIGTVQDLAGRADVFVTHLPQKRAAELGISYDDLSQANPALVYCTITGFGQDGPYSNYPGYEGVVAAKSGRMWGFKGIADREGPVFSPLEVGSHVASQGALAAIVGALIQRETCGHGQLVETSLLRAMMAFDLAGLVRQQIGGPLPDVVNAPLSYHPLPTADGRWLQMGNLLQHLFDNFVIASGLGELYADPRFQGPWGQWKEADREEFRDHMLNHMRTKTASEWMDIFMEHGGVAATEFHTAAEGMDDPDVTANGHQATIEHPELGQVLTLGLLARLGKTPGYVPHDGAERQVSGTSTDQLWPSVAGDDPAPAPSAEPPGNGPLAGTTILEFATIIAAPLGASMLADLGARVIKVEPIGGDPFRGMGDGTGLFALKTTAGKESICLDLKQPQSQEVIQRLVCQADGLIHNYRPGVPEKLGIGYDDLAADRPDLVYVAVNGYGPDGPGAHRPATHPIPGAALGGAVRQSGGAHRWQGETTAEFRRIANRLYRSNEISPDPNTSAVVASATTLGLLARRRFGTGQRILVDMLGANTYANAYEFVNYASRPEPRMPDAGLYGVSATYRLYESQEGWVFLALTNDDEFGRFCRTVGMESLASDGRFATSPAREAHDEALAETLNDLFHTRPAKDWEALLAPKGIGCVQADGTEPGAFWLSDPHVAANGLTTEVPHTRWGSYVRWGANSLCGRTPASLRGAPLAGEHVHSLLDELGFTSEERDDLIAGGVVWSEEFSFATDSEPV